MINLITYPARPVAGGRLEDAARKFGRWMWSAKLNGFRALLHTPTKTLFNRHGGLLAIRDEFEQALSNFTSPFEWLDVEALARRHELAQGSLGIIDLPVPELTSEERYNQLLEPYYDCLLDIEAPAEANRVYLIRQQSLDVVGQLAMWNRLQALNRQFGTVANCKEYYEGMVAKLATAAYPMQLIASTRETPFWLKHRWLY